MRNAGHPYSLLPDIWRGIHSLCHLTHPAGDLWPVPIHKGQFNLPALKPGHYQLHLTRQGQSIWQMPIHIAPLPRVQSDRYYVQAGDNLSIWRQQPLPEGRYQLIPAFRPFQKFWMNCKLTDV